MAIPLLPSGLSVKNIASSAFGGRGSASNVQGNQQEKQQFVEQTKQFVQTQKQNQTVIANMQQQFQNFQNQLNELSKSINNIALLLQKDTLTEQQLLRQQQEQENRYSQRKIRLGRESRLEERIQSAIMAPVEAAANKVESIFSNVGRALQTLFFGYLGVQLLKTIKAFSENDEKTLNEIKDSVLKNVGIVIGTFLAIKGGFALIKYALKRLIGGVTNLIFGGLKNIFTSASSKIGGMISGIFSGGKSKPNISASPSSGGSRSSSGSGGKPSSGASSSSSGTASSPPKSGGGFWGGMKNFGGNILKGGAKLFGGAALTAGLDVAFGEDPATAAAGGITSAGAAAAASKLPLPPILKFPAVLGAGIFGQQIGKDLMKNNTGEKGSDNSGGFDYGNLLNFKGSGEEKSSNSVSPSTKSTPTQTITGGATKKNDANVSSTSPEKSTAVPLKITDNTGNTSNVEPKNTKIPDTKDLQISTNKQDQMPVSGDNTSTLNINQPKETENEKEKLDETISPYTQDYPNISNLFNLSKNLSFDFINSPEDKITSPQSIAPLEEPKPNVIVAQQPQQSQPQPQSPPTPTDTPMIPSSNPDNFYVLYSKLNYNVVI